ncbi:hypothetical protein L596_001020 [Steinernema carpocapsae]|uniref:Uncharacterized protein n=1 Tax=Steinernema carpocapsae TaxID=34508 RepID=A0A4U8UJS6_STECR|nr:hypothetical protein L596_001020 [Steinernema carpocapsae]
MTNGAHLSIVKIDLRSRCEAKTKKTKDQFLREAAKVLVSRFVLCASCPHASRPIEELVISTLSIYCSEWAPFTQGLTIVIIGCRTLLCDKSFCFFDIQAAAGTDATRKNADRWPRIGPRRRRVHVVGAFP